MTLIFCLNHILTEFRPLFNAPNFKLFCAFIIGLIAHQGRATVTGLYRSSSPDCRYWSMIKFLSRGKWNADALGQKLLKILQSRFTNWAYVYDETKATKTGKSQWGLHFFRNHRYRKRNTNPSKFHWGHQFGALGLLCQDAVGALLFPIWSRLLLPGSKRDNSLALLRKILSRIPRGLIIFDRGFNRRKVFE